MLLHSFDLTPRYTKTRGERSNQRWFFTLFCARLVQISCFITGVSPWNRMSSQTHDGIFLHWLLFLLELFYTWRLTRPWKDIIASVCDVAMVLINNNDCNVPRHAVTPRFITAPSSSWRNKLSKGFFYTWRLPSRCSLTPTIYENSVKRVQEVHRLMLCLHSIVKDEFRCSTVCRSHGCSWKL